jgi:hypothetical protein
MNRSEIVKNLLLSFYKQNQDKLKLCKDVGFEYASISDRIKIGTNAIFVASPKNIFGAFKKTHRIGFDSFAKIKSKSEKINIYDLEFSDSKELQLIDDIINLCENIEIEVANYYELQERLRIEKENLERLSEEKRIKSLNQNISAVLANLDENNDGLVDMIENDFDKLLKKHQKTIIGIDKKYIHQFVKISNFIITKKDNTQSIFESIRDTSTQEELEERIKLLKNQIHSYDIFIFHSINMIGSLLSEDLITFYEIYESFDKLGIFNSTWENEVSEKLLNLGDKLDELMFSIYNMEQNIVSELSNLSYITESSFDDLNKSITTQLAEIDSSINLNNLLTGIQTYQLYKINRNTKSLGN